MNEDKKTKSAERKMWGGRFEGKTHPLMVRFSSSVHFDRRLAPYDIRVSKAHARMLGRCAIIPAADASSLERALDEILAEVQAGSFHWDPALEDVHTNIESALRLKIGEAADCLHTARSRNDQVATDLRLFLMDELRVLDERAAAFQASLLGLAKRYPDLIVPGYTHLQRAQPVLFAHHVLAYLEMLERDGERLRAARARMDELPLGACALAGTTFKTDRKFVAKELGFSRVSANSMDAVSDRDYVLEAAAALSILGMHLSRFCEELVLWSSFEFGWIELPDAFTTGSSAMPQKKNPDACELVRAKSGRLAGRWVSLLIMLKGLPLTYNRDLQEDKEAIFDMVDTAGDALEIMTQIAGGIEVRREALAEKEDFMSSMDLAEYLVRRGVPFRQAHDTIGRVVSFCLEQSRSLKDLTVEELKRFSPAFDEDFKRYVGWQASIAAKQSAGGTGHAEVAKALKRWEEKLKKSIA